MLKFTTYLNFIVKFFEKSEDIKIICPQCNKTTTTKFIKDYDMDANYKHDKTVHENMDDLVKPEMTTKAYDIYENIFKGTNDKQFGTISEIAKHKVGGFQSKICYTSEKFFKIFYYVFFDNQNKTAGMTFRIIEEMVLTTQLSFSSNPKIDFVSKGKILSDEIQELLDAGYYKDVIGKMNWELEQNPEYSLAKFYKAIAIAELGYDKNAIELFDEILKKNPRSIDALLNKGISLRKMEMFEDAIDCYDKILEIEPNEASAFSSKGVALRNLGRYDESLACYEKAIDLGLDDYTVWTNKGRVLSALDRNNEAIECYDKALSLSPDDEIIKSLKEEAENKLKN